MGDFVGGSVVKYTAASLAGNKVSFNAVSLPTGAVFTIQTLGVPLVQATNIAFIGTTATSTTASWTNGSGSSRAVFVYAGASGSALPIDLTSYTANTVFGSGTQIGSTGWYCVYNGTGTSVNITGLTPTTTYQVMTLEYSASILGNEVYLSTISTGNPGGITIPNNVGTLINLSISQGTLNPVFASGTTIYIANAVTSLTVTPTTTDSNAIVKVNGVTVTSGGPSFSISLLVGANVINTLVIAQDGTTIETYTVTVTRTALPAIVTTGTLAALTTTYGTASASTTFNVAGTDMLEGILVTAPSGFEISTDDVTFTNTVTVGATGVIASTPVYIRLKKNVPAGSYSGDIILTSDSAITVNVPTVSSTVNKATLTATADNKTKIYGAANPPLTITYSGFANSETEASLLTPPTIATTATLGSPVGSYPIVASGGVDPNYIFDYVDGNLTITPVEIIVEADNQTKAYGAANPALTVTYSGFVNGDDEGVLTTQATITTTADTTSPVGTYPITVTGAAALNYTFNYVPAILTVTPVEITVTADNQTKVYGAVNPTLTASYTGFVNGDDETVLTTAATITTTADITSPVGTYPIAPTGAAALNYTFAYVAGTLMVTPVEITVTADNQTKVYGAANPTLTASYAGFVNGDDETILTTQATITTTADTTSPVGTYPITATGIAALNYTFNYVPGVLTVMPLTDATLANLTISEGTLTPVFETTITNYTATVANAITSLTVTPVVNDSDATVTVNGVAVASGSASGAIPLAVGVNTITTIVTAQDGSTTETYTIIVTRTAIPTIITTGTLSALTTTYGTVSASGTFNVSGTNMLGGILVTSPSGFEVSSDNVTFTDVITIGAAGTIVNTPVYIRLKGTISAGNTYSGNVVLTSNSAATVNVPTAISVVTPAGLIITADNETKVFGDVNPTLTVTYAGFVNGDTSASLTTQPTITTTDVTGSAVGTYPITVSGTVDSNYLITYVTGVLTITASTSSSDADLMSLMISNGTLSPAFSPSITSYNVIVANNVTIENITPTSEDPSATVTVNGIVVTRGTSSGAINLLPGQNTIVTQVTAADGVTIKNYTIVVTRAASNNATLSDLSISNGDLTPAFASNINDYGTAVENNVSSITLTPTLTDPAATVTVNGISVVNGSSSAPINLNTGDNRITIVVTAADGITKETYTVDVYRAVAPNEVIVTNVLTPNGDGKNDFWEIKDILLYPNNKVTVYDRAGRIVYSKNSYTNDWNGSYQGNPLTNETYYYLIDLGPDLAKIKGFITIIRD